MLEDRSQVRQGDLQACDYAATFCKESIEFLLSKRREHKSAKAESENQIEFLQLARCIRCVVNLARNAHGEVQRHFQLAHKDIFLALPAN